MTRPSIAVVEAVAKREGVGARDLDCILADAVDPTALDVLFDPSLSDRTELTARFPYCGYDVTVRADRSVTLEPID
jgi:hypothetical protein